jgi:hypothetical protein
MSKRKQYGEKLYASIYITPNFLNDNQISN